MSEQTTVKVKVLHKGQVAPYKDSIYDYEVESDGAPEAVEEYCKTKLRPCSIKRQNGEYSGSCSFPHGLNKYYRFYAFGPKNQYRYTVCEPYCG